VSQNKPSRLIAGLSLVLLAVTTAAHADITVEPWQRIYDGIDHATGEADSGEPRLQKVNALRIDLTVADLELYTTPSNGGDPDETTSQTASEFLISSGVQVAVNANFYDPALPPPLGSDYKDLDGLAISQGSLVSDQETDVGANRGQVFVATQANDAWFDVTAPTPISLTGIYTAVCGDARLVLNGNINVATGGEAHPRTVVGLSQDDYYLILITIDGRQDGYSEGATLYEAAEWLIRFGAYNGINLDGGGSTTMVRSDDAGGATVLNSPVGAGWLGDQLGERRNGNHLGVFADPVPIDGANGDDLVLYRPNGAQAGMGDWFASYTKPAPIYLDGVADTTQEAFGQTSSIPLLGDVNGDGIDDLVVADDDGSGNWTWAAAHSTLSYSGFGELSSTTTSSIAQFGGLLADSEDQFMGDVNGDGVDDVIHVDTGFYWEAAHSIPGAGLSDSVTSGPLAWGETGDVPLMGDFDGDGLADIALFRAGGADDWYIQKSDAQGLGGGGTIAGDCGLAGDVPLVGDFNGDGRTDVVVLRPSGGDFQWLACYSDANGRPDYWVSHSNWATFGLTTDTPWVADINGDGMDDIGVSRDVSGEWQWRVGFTTAGGNLYAGGTGDDIQLFGYAPSHGDADTMLIGDFGVIAGDFDGDDDLDLEDFAEFQICLGAAVGPDDPCVRTDFDASGAIDLMDWTEFEADFTGPR